MDNSKKTKFEKQSEMLRYNLIRRKRQLEERKKIEENLKSQNVDLEEIKQGK